MTTCVGVDVGGTKIAACAVDEHGTVLRRARRETPAQDPAQIVSAVAEVVEELVDGAVPGEEVRAVGVACARLVDRAGETVVFAPNLAWRDEPLRARLQAHVELPVVLENDANAAAWGEFRFGAARDVDDMVLLTLGTGVGGGLISEGRLLRGAHGTAAEVGHLRVVPDGHRCGCGSTGCWEMHASDSALVREARALLASGSPHAGALSDRCEGDPARLTGQMIIEVARTGDPAATELLETVGCWVGEGAASLAAVLDPGLVVLGGGVSAAADLASRAAG